MQCSLDRRFCTTSVNGNVDGIHPASFLKTKLFYHRISTALRIFHRVLIRVKSGREENVSGYVTFREPESRGNDVNCDDSRCTEGFCDCHAKEAHRTSAPYGDGLSRAEVGEVGDCMNSNRKGLDLHSELAGRKRTEGVKERTIAASSKVMLSGMTYETPAGRR